MRVTNYALEHIYKKLSIKEPLRIIQDIVIACLRFNGILKGKQEHNFDKGLFTVTQRVNFKNDFDSTFK